ncbi:Hypothetical predicted protein [Paramuricea clavata]|uniref:Uncharacterized protein n=1 Tax=Paramuricea clavata TaxID=317549 RepID=A0A6S7IDQ4_PARCT|nr:Hypothetical predicted protein [Paramuricea clavata]
MDETIPERTVRMHPSGINNGNNPLGKTSDDNIPELAEKLQQAFIKPWDNLPPNNELDINLMDQSLRNTTPPLPSIGQVKNCLKHLKPRKATRVDKIPVWILEHFSDDQPVQNNASTQANTNMR